MLPSKTTVSSQTCGLSRLNAAVVSRACPSELGPSAVSSRWSTEGCMAADLNERKP
jgi:hypothetical protein